MVRTVAAAPFRAPHRIGKIVTIRAEILGPGGRPAVVRRDLRWMPSAQLGSFRNVRGSRGTELESIYEKRQAMTGYTVHTGSTEKFSQGWDQIFGGSKQTSGKSKKSASASAAPKKSKQSKSARSTAARKRPKGR